MTESWAVNSKEQAEFFCSYIKKHAEAGIPRIYEIQVGNRTNRQNRAAHLCLRQLAEALNDAGFGIPHPLNSEFQIPYTEESCKELLLRPVMKAMFNKESTSKLETKELSTCFEALLNRIAEVTGVVVNFPQEELYGPS